MNPDIFETRSRTWCVVFRRDTVSGSATDRSAA